MEKSYSASPSPVWNYVGIDEPPPVGRKINVLTSGGTSIVGDSNTLQMIAWADLLGRDKIKELILQLLPDSSVAARRWAVSIAKQKLELFGWDQMVADMQRTYAKEPNHGGS